MGSTIKRTHCTYCGSSNNLCFWEDENGLTRSQCKTPGCEYNSKKSVIPLAQKNSVPTLSQNFLVGEHKEVRGISATICKKLDIQSLGDKLIFNYRDKNNIEKIISQKLRMPSKEMPWINYKAEDIALFGAHACADFKQPIVITEGELDAASVWELGFQAVSIPAGAQSAAKFIESASDWLNQFSRIILLFDNDKPGKIATQSVTSINGLNNLYVGDLKIFKDANDALQKNKEAIKEAIQNAKEYTPSGIIFGNQINIKELLIPEEPGKELPFEKLNTTVRGLKSGKIILIGAGTGTGKSTFSKEVALHLMNKYPAMKIASIFLEEEQKHTLHSYIAMQLNKRVFDVSENPIEAEIQKGFALLNNPNLAFVDHFGSLQKEDLLHQLEYLASVKKFNLIILDHISIVVSGMDSKEGERRDIDVLMTKLKALTVKTGVTIIVISHLKRADGEVGYENGKPVTLASFRGSASLGQLSDIVISLERDQQNEHQSTQTIIRMLKNRITGKLGVADTLYYNETTGRLTTLEKIFSTAA
jgi:twinkle protein